MKKITPLLKAIFKSCFLVYFLLLPILIFAQDQQPKKIIFDTDIGPDWDDVGAAAVLHELANLGEAEILAMCVSSGGSSGIWGPPCLDAINTYYGRPDIPIGVAQGGPDFGSSYNKQIAEEFQQDLGTSNAWDAVELYRKIMSEQSDSSITIVTVGFMTNLAKLLQSSSDSYSPLNGLELVNKKVKQWVCMGGGFPSSGGEFNFNRDAESTKDAVENWPTSILFSGFEIGAPIRTGAKLALTSISNPIRRAYELAGGYVGSIRSSWDQTAVLSAIRNPLLYWDLETTGYCSVAENGANQWLSSPDKDHSYLIKKLSNDEMTEIIDDLMANLQGLPEVQIISPNNEASFEEGANIQIEAVAVDTNGQISKVEFYARSDKIGEATSYPYNMVWNNVSTGGYYLSAKAFDNEGNSASSNAIKIFVGDFDVNFVANWNFENNVVDSSKHGNDGIISGHPEFVDGRIGDKALKFNNSEDYVKISPSADFSTTDFTLSAWVKFPNTIPDGWRTIIEHNRWGKNWFGLWKSANGNKFHFRWANEGNATSDFNSGISPNTWYHITASYDGIEKTARLYLNGELDKIIQNADKPEPIDSELRIGINMENNEELSGIVDNIIVYSRVLSGTEINDLLILTSVDENYDSANELLPQKYSLSNYPNPFNPSTTITYSIPIDSQVKLNVYDMNGSKVSTLVNSKKQAGTYIIPFSNIGLSSGIYLYRIVTEHFELTQKMILLK